MVSQESLMNQPLPFAEVLEAVEQLSTEDQESLVEIVRRRVAERGRMQRRAEVQDARREYEQGKCQPSTVDELMDEIPS